MANELNLLETNEQPCAQDAEGARSRFAEVLRRLRAASGMGVRELARRIGMRASSVSQYENGRQTPSPGAVRRISKALNVPPDLLLWFAYTQAKVPDRREVVFRRVDEVMCEQVGIFEMSLRENREQKPRTRPKRSS